MEWVVSLRLRINLNFLKPMANSSFLFPQAKGYLKKHSTTTGCLCGDVVAFNVPLAIEQAQLTIPSTTIGRYVRTFELGCTGKNMRLNNKNMTCLHISRRKLPSTLLNVLDKGNYKHNLLPALKAVFKRDLKFLLDFWGTHSYTESYLGKIQ